MSKTNSYETALLNLIFNGITLDSLAENKVVNPITFLYVSFHTSDPGEAANQETNEMTVAAYAGYARIPVARTAGGWIITGNTVNPAAAITFPLGTGGSGANATHFGIGTAATGAGFLLYKGPITPNIACGDGITPQLTTDTSVIED